MHQYTTDLRYPQTYEFSAFYFSRLFNIYQYFVIFTNGCQEANCLHFVCLLFPVHAPACYGLVEAFNERLNCRLVRVFSYFPLLMLLEITVCFENFCLVYFVMIEQRRILKNIILLSLHKLYIIYNNLDKNRKFNIVIANLN
ncbi:MAG: hypothetical protein ACFWUC_13300 [Oscillospiraceae bacterium]|jgi:hypothetical protein